MITDGQQFLEKLAKFPPNTFEGKFLRKVTRLGLCDSFAAEELRLLYRASFRAGLCNIALNGLGGCIGLIRPEGEFNRVRLEHDFMAFRNHFFACAGWQRLLGPQRERIEQQFLSVAVAEENLAW
jgi:hypothetical protein